MNITCEHARTLLPGYLDGELSEAHASPLRAHLFDCVGCRESVKQGKNLQRWFQDAAPEPVELPAGFAARVARRALAGDPGLTDPVPAPAGGGTLSDFELEPLARRGAPEGRREKPLLPFLLTSSAVAAAVLFLFALGIQKASLPQGSDLFADEKPSWMRDLPPGESRGPLAGDAAATGDFVLPEDPTPVEVPEEGEQR